MVVRGLRPQKQEQRATLKNSNNKTTGEFSNRVALTQS
jgi:hypothetical protein